MDVWITVAGGALAVAVTSLALWVLVRMAPRLGLLDRPDARKRHHGVVPMVGGLAILAGVLAASLWLDGLDNFERLLLATTTALVVLGAIDDRRSLGVTARIVLQVAIIGSMIVFGGVHVRTLGTLFGLHANLGWFGIPFTVVAVIGLLNAFNLIDGLDGLAGGVSLVAIAAILLASGVPPTHGTGLVLVLLGCALLPFLAANVGWLGARNRCFLGDAGSTLLGYVLGWALIQFSQPGHTSLSPVGTLWCVALPVMDVFAVMFRRVRQHRNPFKPGRGHIHHLLLALGLSRRATVVALTCAAAGLWLVGNAVSVLHFGRGSNLAAFCVMTIAYMAVTDWLWRARQAAEARAEASAATGAPPAIRTAPHARADAARGHAAAAHDNPLAARMVELPARDTDDDLPTRRRR